MQPKDVKKRKHLPDEDTHFAIVWMEDSDDTNPFCYASSHRDAQEKVDVLTEELEAFVDAGGDFRGAEESIKFFYTTNDGKRWEWKNGEAQPLFYVGGLDNWTKDNYTSDDEKVGKQMKLKIKKYLYYYDHSTKKKKPVIFLSELDNVSMAASVSLSMVNERDELFVNFWKKIREMGPAKIQVLRSIYSLGDYTVIEPLEHDKDTL